MSAPIVTGCGLPVFGTETCEGQIITYYSAQMTVTCPAQDTGGPFTSPLGKFTSIISQADADSQAEAYLVNLLATGCVQTVFPPVITSPLTANIGNSVAFTYQITATNSPTSFNATSLPSGLSVNTSTGLISGTITSATIGSTYSIPISAMNAGGTGSATLVLTVIATLNANFITIGDGGASTLREVSIDGSVYTTVNFSQNYIFLHQIKMRTTVTNPTPVFGDPQFQWNMESGLIGSPDSSLWSKPLQASSIASIIGTSLGSIRCINQWGGNGGSPGLDYTFPSASSTNQTDNLSGTLSSNTTWEHLITHSGVSFSSLVMETILNF
jgi:hypothetical protein